MQIPQPIVVTHTRVVLSERKPLTMRYSIDAIELMAKVGRKMGMGRVAVMELALRDLAERKGIAY
jgi:hypothetical protein